MSFSYVTGFEKTRLPRTKIKIYFIGPMYSYTQELPIHHISCGKAEVVCFSGGWICGTVNPWPTHWCLRSAPIGPYRPGIVPMTRMTAPWTGGVIVPICDVISPFKWSRGFFPPPSPPPPPHPPLPSSHPPTPLLTWPEIGEYSEKNRLKRPKFQQGDFSKVNCVIDNR